MQRVPAWQASDGTPFFNRAEGARHEAALELKTWVEETGLQSDGGQRAVTARDILDNAPVVLAMLKRIIPPKAKEPKAAPEPSGEPAAPGAESTETRARGRRRGGLAGAS